MCKQEYDASLEKLLAADYMAKQVASRETTYHFLDSLLHQKLSYRRACHITLDCARCYIGAAAYAVWGCYTMARHDKDLQEKCEHLSEENATSAISMLDRSLTLVTLARNPIRNRRPFIVSVLRPTYSCVTSRTPRSPSALRRA